MPAEWNAEKRFETIRHETTALDHPIKISHIDNDVIVLAKLFGCSLPVSTDAGMKNTPKSFSNFNHMYERARIRDGMARVASSYLGMF